MVRYIIGKNVDKAFKIHLIPPVNVPGTSEMCRENDLFTLQLTAPYLNDNVASRTFVAHLYASNSRSNPYTFESDNYWVNLIPTWRFYADDGKTIIDDILVETKPTTIDNKKVMYGEVKFHYVDDMPSTTDKAICVWVTIDTEKVVAVSDTKVEIDYTESDIETDVVFPGTTKSSEIIKRETAEYHPPSYANSTVIAVCTYDVNPVWPTKISITRNSINSISEGIYWSNQIIPFIATVNSDHYADFRDEASKNVVWSSDVVYNFPPTTALTATLTGSMKLEYQFDPATGIKSLVERYVDFVENDWEFLADYVPPKEILETSGTLSTSGYTKNILEIMDYPTYDDLKMMYPDIPLDDYFENICTTCSGASSSGEPDKNILYLEEYNRLVLQHPEFEYLPYALRIVETISYDHDKGTQYIYSPMSGYWDETKQPIFQLLDMTNGYNYKIGGYTFGKMMCPDLSGKDYTAETIASAYIEDNDYKKTDFHVFKYWVVADGRFVYTADDRDCPYQDYNEIESYIRDKVTYQAIPDEKLNSVFEKTVRNEMLQIEGGFIGVNCAVQDPLYNTWVCDADTGFIYKFSIDNQLLVKINLDEEISMYVNRFVKSQIVKNWWFNYRRSGEGLTPTSMVLDSQNNLYITMFDTMAIIKVDGKNGGISDLYIFPENELKESDGVHSFPIDSGWRPVAVDVDEYDNVAVLFNTSNEKDDSTIYPDLSEKLPFDLRIIVFNNGNFIDDRKIRVDSSIMDDDDEIFGKTIPGKDLWYFKHLDVNSLVYRSDENFSYVYFTGSIWVTAAKEIALLFRLDLTNDSSKLEILSKTVNNTGPNGPPINHHIDYDSLFMDEDDTLWFAENHDRTMIDSNKVSSKLKAIVNSTAQLGWECVTIDKLYNNNGEKTINFNSAIGGISGITSSSHDELVIVDPANKKIKKLKRKSKADQQYGPTDLGYDSRFDISIPGVNGDYEIGSIFARGDWSGMAWINKHSRTIKNLLTTVFGENTMHLNSYETRYIRKHHDEWDVAEHMKIPVKNTTFPEENEQLFKAIGETLGIDEHKHYSIGRKIYEGIANQVANVHDIDECHIDSIYSISDKEDVNIDKFIFTYPEELRRISDLSSIARKKLWGNRCHCNQNYFKAKTRDTERYCDKCKHVHTSNVGSSIDPMDCSLWNGVLYKLEHNFDITENTWFMLAPVILLVSRIVNEIFDPEKPVTCDVVCPYCHATNTVAVTYNNTEFKCPNCNQINYLKDGILKMRDCIKPMNQMLDVVQNYVDEYLTPITMSSNTYDVIRMLRLIDDAILSVPNAYLVEDKFNRKEFQRITISRSSYQEAEKILKQINDSKYAIEHEIPINGYLTIDDYKLMVDGKTNDKIILYITITNIEDDALSACGGKIPTDIKILRESIRCAQLLAIHTSFFVPDHWFNYCYWHFIPDECHNLNTGVINWESKYTTLKEKDYPMRKSWLEDRGMMVQLMNYIFHNGTLFHRNGEYIDD